MAFNGSGVFTRLYNWVNDAAANIKIRADRMDNEMNGFATGLSTCITKDGQTTITANLPMAGFRHTGVGDASTRTQYASFGQVQDGKTNWVDGGGTSDAITAAYSIPLTALVDGQLCYVRATAANTTTTPTFSPSSLTARTIVKQGGSALSAGDISGDGHELILRYDLSNTRWELLNPKVTTIPFTAASSSGPASMNFAEDTDNGTNKVTVIAPSSLASDVTATLPSSTGTMTTTADKLSVFAATTSAELASVLSDETGSDGGFMRATQPTTSGLIHAAGTTSVASHVLTSGTNLTTATAGSWEYDGKVAYLTPQGTQRGVSPAIMYYRLDSSLAGANVNTAQAWLGVGVTLSSSTVYRFKGVFALSKSAGTTSHNTALLFGGTATVNNIGYRIDYANNTSGLTTITTDTTLYAQTASSVTVATGYTSANNFDMIAIEGEVSINSGGTFIPQYILSAAPGGAYTTAAGSWFEIYPIGASGANINVGPWA